jgi:hypothetical protein
MCPVPNDQRLHVFPHGIHFTMQSMKRPPDVAIGGHSMDVPTCILTSRSVHSRRSHVQLAFPSIDLSG